MSGSSFKNFVQVGRVVTINYGPETGKLAVIVEVIDQSRALIEGPTTGVKRQAYAYRRLTLTPFVVEGLPRGAGSKVVKKIVEKSGIVAKYAASTQGVKAAKREARAKMNDFDRFKLMVAKKARRYIVGKEYTKARKSVQ